MTANDGHIGDYAGFPNHPLRDVPQAILDAARAVMDEVVESKDVSADMARPIADAVVMALGIEVVGHAREYVEPGVDALGPIHDVGDTPLTEYGASDYTLPVFRIRAAGHIGRTR